MKIVIFLRIELFLTIEISSILEKNKIRTISTITLAKNVKKNILTCNCNYQTNINLQTITIFCGKVNCIKIICREIVLFTTYSSFFFGSLCFYFFVSHFYTCKCKIYNSISKIGKILKKKIYNFISNILHKKTTNKKKFNLWLNLKQKDKERTLVISKRGKSVKKKLTKLLRRGRRCGWS